MTKDLSTEIFSVKITNDDKFIACGCGDGKIRIFDFESEKFYNDI